MRNLMLLSQHWDYVEPFMKPVNTGKGRPTKMSLALINDRLRNYHYSNALQFATDVRRIITEAYRAAVEPVEEDFRLQKARLLQREFEMQFARVREEEESETGGMNKASIMKDPYISKLIQAQALLTGISNGINSLTSDVVTFVDKRRERRKAKVVRRQNMATAINRSVTYPYSAQSPPKKRQRISQGSSHGLGGLQSASNVRVPATIPSATPEQIGEWIQNLEARGQEHLLEILKRNGESIEVDDEGEVELSLENWSDKTLADVESYLRQELIAPAGLNHRTPNTSIVQNQAIIQPYNKPPKHHLTSMSHAPNSVVPGKTPKSAFPFDRKTKGRKKISKTDSHKSSEQYGSDSSDGSESSNSSDDESSSSGDNSSEMSSEIILNE